MTRTAQAAARPTPGGNEGDAVGSVEGAATAMPGSALDTASAGTNIHTIGPVGDRGHDQLVMANPGTGGTGVRADYDSDSAGLSGYPQGMNTGPAGGHSHSESAEGNHTLTITGGDRETRPVNVTVNFLIKS